MSSAPAGPNQYIVAVFGGADGEPEGVTNVRVGDRFVYTGNRPDFVLLADPTLEDGEWKDDEVECPPDTVLKLMKSYPVYTSKRTSGRRGAHTILANPYMNYEFEGVDITFKCTVPPHNLRRMINSEQLRKIPARLQRVW